MLSRAKNGQQRQFCKRVYILHSCALVPYVQRTASNRMITEDAAAVGMSHVDESRTFQTAVHSLYSDANVALSRGPDYAADRGLRVLSEDLTSS